MMEQTYVFDANLQKELLSIQTEFQEQVLRLHQVSCRQEGFNYNLFWTVWWSNQDQHFSRSNLRSRPSSWKAFSFCWANAHSLFWRWRRWPIIWVFKEVVTIKLLNTYTNNNPQDPHGLKKQVKIEYEATKGLAGTFPNGTASLMELLNNAQPAALYWTAYCDFPEANQLVWE